MEAPDTAVRLSSAWEVLGKKALVLESSPDSPEEGNIGPNESQGEVPEG